MDYKEKVQRNKERAEYFLKEDIRAFVVDINSNYDFCDILFVGEDKITYVCFAGKRIGQKITQPWSDIVDIKEYRRSN